ncbi:MAG: DMT family transporter [Chloroflexi bacterium]|nr:DMT family transporter [Chloroflexota bacterium]
MSAVAASVVFGLLAAAGWGIADFIAAAASKRVGVLRTATGVHLASAVAAAGYFVIVFEPSVVKWQHWAILGAMSVGGVLVYVAFYRALLEGPVVVVSPIVSSYAIILIGLAVVFAGERLSLWQTIGAVCSVGGVVLASFDPRSLSAGGRLIGLGVALAIVTMIGLGGLSYALGIMSRELGWFLPVFITRVVSTALFIPLTFAMRQWTFKGVTIALALLIAFAGIVEMGGMFAYARGTEVGVISIVAAASISYPLIPMLGGIILFRERLAFSQWVGLCITLSGLFVLALAS